MIDPLLSGAIIFSSLLTLLSIGLTLTYMTTKVPNFAHGAFAAVGAYVTLTAVKIWGANPYHFLFLAFIIGGMSGLAQYLVVFRPLIKKRVTIVGLMIATLAIEFILLSVLNIYADFLSREFKIRSRFFLLSVHDLEVAGYQGLLVAAPSLALVSVTVLYLALTRTKFGVAMRAAIEDQSLAGVVGINVNLVYAVSWFVAGGLGSLSGALLPLWFPGNPDMGSKFIVSVFASSIVGGLVSIYGAVVGGLLIGLTEILGTSQLAFELGSWVHPYRPLIPLIAIAITLLLASEGLVGISWRSVIKEAGHRVTKILRTPKSAFNDVKDEDSLGKKSVKHLLELLVIFALPQTLLFTFIPEYYTTIMAGAASIVPISYPAKWPPLLGFIYLLVGGLLVVLSISFLTHIWIYLFKGVRGRKGVGQTVKSIAYGSTPQLLLGWIPFLGIVVLAWSMTVSAVGVKQLHGVSIERAVTALLLGVASFCIIVGLLVLSL